MRKYQNNCKKIFSKIQIKNINNTKKYKGCKKTAIYITERMRKY